MNRPSSQLSCLLALHYSYSKSNPTNRCSMRCQGSFQKREIIAITDERLIALKSRWILNYLSLVTYVFWSFFHLHSEQVQSASQVYWLSEMIYVSCLIPNPTKGLFLFCTSSIPLTLFSRFQENHCFSFFLIEFIYSTGVLEIPFQVFIHPSSDHEVSLETAGLIN